jgi:hypothetical protein
MMCRKVRRRLVSSVIIGASVMGGCGRAPRAAPDAGNADDPPMSPIDAGTVDAPRLDAPWTSNVVRASPTGDDASDGVAAPVRTIGRAVALAALHPEVQVIALDAGTYSAATGESFPYTIPDHVLMAGPVQGRAILSGDATKTGLIVNSGQLQAIEFESFSLGVEARGSVTAADLKFRGSAVAIRATTAADLTLRRIDIASVTGACATGIRLAGGAVLHASDVTAGPIGAALEVRDQAAATLVRVTAVGDRTCGSSTVDVYSDGSLDLRDSNIDGGLGGLGLGGATQPLVVNLSNVTVRNADVAVYCGLANGTFSGGTLLQNSFGMALTRGSWTVTNVRIEGTQYYAIAVGGTPTYKAASLVMRGCTLRGNAIGVLVEDLATVDLGTASSPGHNIIQGSSQVGVDSGGTLGPSRIDAAGNTWQPRMQGSDDAGKLAPTTLTGPYGGYRGDNFWIASPLWSIQL